MGGLTPRCTRRPRRRAAIAGELRAVRRQPNANSYARGFRVGVRRQNSEGSAMKMVAAGSCAILIAMAMHGRALDAAASCESLSSMTLPNASITLAQLVPAGGFTPPGTGASA